MQSVAQLYSVKKMINELERIWKEVDVAYIEVLFWASARIDRGKPRKRGPK
jgi:hypothetical protein